jgi:hypothetical protein
MLPRTSRTQAAQRASRVLLDMVHFNPGEPPPTTAFLDPHYLSDWGYSGKVIYSNIEGVPTFEAIAPGLIAPNSIEKQWADETAVRIAGRIRAAKAAGLRTYAWMQCVVLPKAVIARFQDEICDSRGRIDMELPGTQRLLRAQFREIFQRFPDLDGLVIRTGEIYLHELPYHTSSGADPAELRQGSTAIIHGEHSHRVLLDVLRSEVCSRLGRSVIYRTWDFGQNFHANPRYYLAVTDSIDPHPQLVFSVKHQAGDFHQLTRFNPTLMIGKHRQIVEVQCQREGYGKGSHPYYIGKGVIEGWEEFAWLMRPCEAKGLRDIGNHPLFAGIWTWSRGGGWDGPYIKDEFWCALNARVISQFEQNRGRTEEEIFADASRRLGLRGKDIGRFRELNLLSTRAVLRGQLTTLGAEIDVWWVRDDKLGAPNLSDFIQKGIVEESIAEKREAVAMWKEIERLSASIAFPSGETNDFVRTSAAYGRMKYTVIQHGWTILLLGQIGVESKTYDKHRIAQAIADYDEAWKAWRELTETRPFCSTLYKDYTFDGKPGLGAAVNRYRGIIGS